MILQMIPPDGTPDDTSDDDILPQNDTFLPDDTMTLRKITYTQMIFQMIPPDETLDETPDDTPDDTPR
jgi:hypothetical protein